MDKELQIKITADRSAAQASAAEELRSLERVRDTYRQLAAEQTRVAGQVSGVQIREAREASAVQIQALDRVGEAVRRQSAQWTRMHREAMREDRATSQVMLFNLEKIRESVARLSRERAAASTAAGREAKGFDDTARSASGAFAAVKSFAGQMLSLDAARGVLRGIVDEFEKIRKAASDASRDTTSGRGNLRELAALRGNAGDTTTTARDLFAFRRITMQSQDEAIQFQLAALGAGESSIGRNVSRQDFEAFMGSAGAFGTTIGADAGTMGRLAGVLPSLVARDGRQVSAPELTGRLRQLESIFKPGGGTYTQLANQLIDTSSFTMTGVYRDVADQAALLSFFSLTNAQGAGTMVEQFTRATAGGLGRMRGSSIMEGIGSDEIQKQAEYLAGIGATEAMDPIQIGMKIAEDVRAQQKAGGRDFNAFTYLQSKGYANIQDIQTLMAFIGGLENFQGTFLRTARAPVDVSGAMPEVDRFRRVDPFASAAAAALATEEATFAIGAGGGEFAEQARRQAFARMKARGEAFGTYEEFTQSSIPLVGPLRRQAIDREAARGINASLPADRRIDVGGESEPLSGLAGGAAGGVGGGLGFVLGPVVRGLRAYATESARREALARGTETVILEGGAPVGADPTTAGAASDAAGNLRRLVELSERAARGVQISPPLRPPARPNGDTFR